jgi:hypothetical protein
MRSASVTAALMFASCMFISGPAFAQYGAIAWDKESGRYGASWNQASQKGADEVALSDCGATACKVIIRTTRAMCAALATNESGKYAGGAARRNRDAARVGALKNCQKGNAGECTVRVTDCNK